MSEQLWPQNNTEGEQIKDNVKILNGQETVDLVKQISQQCSPDFAAHMLESNNVLTLAGLKPQTEFFVDMKDESQFEQVKADVDKLNAWFEKQGLPLVLITKQDFVMNKEDRLFCMVGLINMQGLEIFSRNTHLPGIELYDSQSGFEGYKVWWSKMLTVLKSAQARGEIAPEVDLEIILSGVAKGYPDQAILDFERALREGKMDQLVDSKIAHVGTYQEAQPNYDFFPEHVDDPTIVKNIRQAGKILEEFYSSDWHQGLKK